MLRSLLKWTLVLVIWSSASIAGPLHDAVKDGDVVQLKQLIEAGEDLSLQDKFVGTALHWAALTDNADAARILIEAGIDLNAAKFGVLQTALHIAAERGSAEVAALLVASGADIEARTDQGETPLLLALGWDQVNVAKLLIEAGADMEARPFGGGTTLMVPATTSAAGAIELLVAAGADIDEKGPTGQTALHVATGRGGPDAVRKLIELGADVNGAPETEPVFASTPLAMAIARGRDEIADILREAGAVE